jgi:riboflavin biosynthesis pyrimidine reductase
VLEPFDVLVEDRGDPLPLPDTLVRIYGGPLSLPERRLYANFVQSVDGVVAIPGVVSSGSVISGRSEADRFVMGLLRACAEAVLVGAGTLRDTPNHHWTAEHVYPDLADGFRQLREALAIAPQPRLAVITASGDVDVAHPAIRGGATFLTTAAGAARLAGTLPEGCDLRTWEGDEVPVDQAVEWLRQAGFNRLLSEAGPKVTGQLIAQGLLEDVFLSVSPVIAGRDGRGQLGMVEGQALLPDRRLEVSLASARRSRDFLLLRYALVS